MKRSIYKEEIINILSGLILCLYQIKIVKSLIFDQYLETGSRNSSEFGMSIPDKCQLKQKLLRAK